MTNKRREASVFLLFSSLPRRQTCQCKAEQALATIMSAAYNVDQLITCRPVTHDVDQVLHNVDQLFTMSATCLQRRPVIYNVDQSLTCRPVVYNVDQSLTCRPVAYNVDQSFTCRPVAYTVDRLFQLALLLSPISVSALRAEIRAEALSLLLHSNCLEPELCLRVLHISFARASPPSGLVFLPYHCCHSKGFCLSVCHSAAPPVLARQLSRVAVLFSASVADIRI